MSKPEDVHIATEQIPETKDLLLQSIQRFSWVLLAFLIGGSWYMYDWLFAQSILFGGLLANISFFLMRRDIKEFMDSFTSVDVNLKAVKKIGKVKFFFRFYGRLTALAFILYLLLARLTIDVIGLVIGLSTIMFSIIVVSIKSSLLYSAQR